MRPTYSASVRRIQTNAQTEAGRYKHRFVHTEYLLLGLLQDRNAATGILKELGVDRNALRNMCKQQCQRGEHSMEASLKLTPRAQQVMALAGEQMTELGHEELDSRHLLLGLILEEKGVAGNVLRHAGVTAEAVRQAVRAMEQQPPQPREEAPREIKEPVNLSGSGVTHRLRRIWGRT